MEKPLKERWIGIEVLKYGSGSYVGYDSNPDYGPLTKEELKKLEELEIEFKAMHQGKRNAALVYAL